MKIQSVVFSKNYHLNPKSVFNPPSNIPEKNRYNEQLPSFYSLSYGQVNFKGKPATIPVDLSEGSNPAVFAFNCFSDGSYLDSHDDEFNPEYKDIRTRNFSLFDKPLTPAQKADFISHYRAVTGFPDLKKVSQKIEDEFGGVVLDAEDYFDIPEAQCVSAGYDPTCSVGRGYALPGSNLDKSYVIIQGSDDRDADKEIVGDYSGYLWRNTDQRILSYNHSASFPNIMTVGQIKDILKAISERTRDLEFDSDESERMVQEEFENPTKAARYNILVSDYFPVRNRQKAPLVSLDKEEIKNFAYFLEAYRDGKEILSSDASSDLRREISDENFYRYSNVSQIQALKRAIELDGATKTKFENRKQLAKEFASMSLDAQYEAIINFIKYSCEDQESFSELFDNDSDLKLKYKKLLARMAKGVYNEYYLPEFKPCHDGYSMTYGLGKKIHIYRGADKNTLWVNFSCARDISRLIEDIDLVRRIEKFKDVDKIQCAMPTGRPFDGFHPTMFRTSNGLAIQEIRLKN